MKNKSELFTKEWADRYIRESYERLEAKFRVLDDKINDKGVSSLDKLNDTMLALYDKVHLFESYGAFKKWADIKFTPKTERKREIDDDKNTENNV